MWSLTIACLIQTIVTVPTKLKTHKIRALVILRFEEALPTLVHIFPLKGACRKWSALSFANRPSTIFGGFSPNQPGTLAPVRLLPFQDIGQDLRSRFDLMSLGQNGYGDGDAVVKTQGGSGGSRIGRGLGFDKFLGVPRLNFWGPNMYFGTP